MAFQLLSTLSNYFLSALAANRSAIVDKRALEVINELKTGKYKAIQGVQNVDIDFILEDGKRQVGFRSGACFAQLSGLMAKAGKITHIVYIPHESYYKHFTAGEALDYLSGAHSVGLLRPYVGPPEDIYFKKEFTLPVQSYDASADRLYISLSTVRFLPEFPRVAKATVELYRAGVPFLMALFIAHSRLMASSGHSFLNVSIQGYGNRESAYDLAYLMRLRDYLGRLGPWAVADRNLTELIYEKQFLLRSCNQLDEICKKNDSLPVGDHEKMISNKSITAFKAATIEEARVILA